MGVNWHGILESDSRLSETSSRLLKLADDRWKDTCCLSAGRTVDGFNNVIKYFHIYEFVFDSIYFKKQLSIQEKIAVKEKKELLNILSQVKC